MENIKENCILIDEFMGKKYTPYNDNHSIGIEFNTHAECEVWIAENKREGFIPQLNFRKEVGNYLGSWDELMPVVEKIENLYFNRPVVCSIGSSGIYIALNETNVMGEKFSREIIADTLNINYNAVAEDNSDRYSKIEGVFLGVVQFVKWFNNQK